jgi:NAD(P)-dependent dehydrogenase (short-subunit alcohol dehydrogenase family)
VRADITREDEIRAAIEFAVVTFGGLDVLVNNAGGTPRPHFPDAPVEHWSRTLDLNLRGPMLAIQLALPEMRKEMRAPSSTSRRSQASAGSHTARPSTPQQRRGLRA